MARISVDLFLAFNGEPSDSRIKSLGERAQRAAACHRSAHELNLTENVDRFGPLFWGRQLQSMELVRAIACAVPPWIAWFFEDYPVDASWFYEAAIFLRH